MEIDPERRNAMTLKEIELLDRDFLTVAEVAGCLKCDPQLVRDQTERNPKYLGFSIAKIGHSYKIPRLAFIAWMKGTTPIIAWKESGLN